MIGIQYVAYPTFNLLCTLWIVLIVFSAEIVIARKYLFIHRLHLHFELKNKLET